MKDNISTFITVKGKFVCDEEQNVIVTELSGTASLLLEEPQTIINEIGETNLTEFLKENVQMGSYISVRRVVVDNINELFQNSIIVDNWKERLSRNINVTDKLYDNDGVLMLGNKTLYDVFWENSYVKQEYAYVEIYIHNTDMSKAIKSLGTPPINGEN